MNKELDLPAIRFNAEAVKDREWILDGFADGDDYVRLALYSDEVKKGVIAEGINRPEYAAYFASLDPGTVLAIIDRAEFMQEYAERREAQRDSARRSRDKWKARAEAAEAKAPSHA